MAQHKKSAFISKQRKIALATASMHATNQKVDVGNQKSIVGVFPMMPRRYNARQRSVLKYFEKQCMAGRKIVIV